MLSNIVISIVVPFIVSMLLIDKIVNTRKLQWVLLYVADILYILYTFYVLIDINNQISNIMKGF
jgi:Ca2+/Na+ antiporter